MELATRYYFLSECCCLKFEDLFVWGALSDDRTGLQLAMQSLNGPSGAEPVTILYCFIWDSPNVEGQVPVYTSPMKSGPVQSQKSKSRYDLRSVNQYVSEPSPRGFRGAPSEEFQSHIRRVTVRQNCLCYHWEGCMWSMQCNVEFGYQLNICSGIKENHGKPSSSWPVAGTSGCKLNSSQQSGIKYAILNVSPYLWYFILFVSLKTFISCFREHFYLYII
jgi:hypothetical protein